MLLLIYNPFPRDTSIKISSGWRRPRCYDLRITLRQIIYNEIHFHREYIRASHEIYQEVEPLHLNKLAVKTEIKVVSVYLSKFSISHAILSMGIYHPVSMDHYHDKARLFSFI